MQNPENREKLLALADVIETRENFNQDLPYQCVIGIGLELAELEFAFADEDYEVFAEHYGITSEQAYSLYWAAYDDLFPNETNHDRFNLHRVSRQEAARILRRLATE